jgi:hypothetical protein
MSHFQMALSGTLNGVDFSISGAGRHDSVRGFVEGEYCLQRQDELHQVIEGVNHGVFNCMIITGYPSEAEMMPGTYNPFRGRSCQYNRRIRFLHGGDVNLEARIDFADNDLLTSNFQVHGDVTVPPLVLVEPTVETWVPVGPNRILGSFVMSWVSEDGGRVVAIAESEYEILGDSETTGVQHRWIEIETQGSFWQFSHRQRSILFSGISVPLP